MCAARLQELILANAEEIGRLHTRVKETARLRDRSPDGLRNWQQASEAFHNRYDALAFPGGYSTALDRIAASEPAAVDAALCFLEARPFFFRSGYMFKDILRKVKRANLSKEQAARLAGIAAAYEQYRVTRRRAHAA
jgi:hypothetical protein